MGSYEGFKNFAGGVQSLLVAGGVLLAAWYGTPVIKAKREVADLDKARAEAAIKIREAAPKVVINAELTAAQIGQTDKSGARWIAVTISLSNSGNTAQKIDLSKDARFYVARIKSVDEDGTVTFEKRRKLQFDYADKTIEWFMLRPGSDYQKLRAIQSVDGPGLYLARFSAPVPDEKLGQNREYSAETYFVVQ